MDGIIEIQNKIYQIRGVRVMLDFDLAELYQVETRTLKQAVRRNIERFPDDFLIKLPEMEFKLLINSGVSQIVIPPGYNPGGAEMFAFTAQGGGNWLIISLRSQFVTSNERGGRRHMPFAFTEHGVIMLASLLRSEIAVQMSVQITRAFVSMRNYIMSTRHIEAELAELRAKLELLERNDEDNLAAVNDLSEDMREEISNIYQAIAALSVKVHQSVADQSRQKIGFKTGKDEKK